MHCRPALRRVVGTTGLCLVALAGARLSEAQVVRQLPAGPLAQLLPDLILRDITLDSPPVPPGVPGVPEGLTHLAHFSPIESGDLNNPVVGLVQAFNSQMATQFSTFPLGSSSGGLTYVFDETVGTFRHSSRSFGPLFGERALTLGQGRFNVGFNYQYASFSRFEGQDLEDGAIRFYLRHEDCCTVRGSPDPPGFVLTLDPNGTRLNTPFEADLIEAALSVDATTHTTAVFANYGVTDRWDVGLAVPFVRVTMDASVTARVIRFATAVAPTLHAFDASVPEAPLILNASGSAAGLGDMVVRTKYRVFDAPGGGVAAAVDLRLPTGDEDNLLGTGGVEAKVLVVVSGERGRFGPHVNLGYTFAGGDSPGTIPGLASASLPDEVNYSAGLEFVATPRLTLIGDLVGRTLLDTGRLGVVSKDFLVPVFDPPPGTTPGCENSGFACTTASFDEFEQRPGSVTHLLGTGGLKFNVAGNLLLTASALFPLSDEGLRSSLAVMAGLDYAF